MKLSNTMKLLITVYSLKYKTMSSYRLKCRKNTKSINPRVSKTNNAIKQCYYQNVQYVVVKTQDLSKNKKQVEY